MTEAKLPDWAKLAIVLAVVAILGAGGLEGSVRLRQHLRYGSSDPNFYKSTVDPASGLVVPVPGQNTKSIWINSHGFRSPEIPVSKPADTIRLAFLGASTTFCAEVSSNQATWPYLVWKALQERFPRTRFDFLNAGVVGYTTTSNRKNLDYRVKPFHPDVIIMYEGFNDVTRDTRPLAQEEHLFTGELGAPDFMARHSVAWNLIEKNLELMWRTRGPKNGRSLRFDSEGLRKEGFEDRLDALVADAQSVAPVVALATLSLKARPEQTLEERRRNLEWMLFYMPFMTADGMTKAFGYYNDTIREIAKNRSAVLIGDENSIPGDSAHFRDSAHFTDAGAILMSDRVVHALAASPSFQKLVNSRPQRNLVSAVRN